jgi:hypothetical protein
MGLEGAAGRNEVRRQRRAGGPGMIGFAWRIAGIIDGLVISWVRWRTFLLVSS